MAKVLCTGCGQIIESVHRHDYKTCKCENHTSVDGGSDYTKCGGVDLSKIYVWDEKRRVFRCCTSDHEIRIPIPE